MISNPLLRVRQIDVQCRRDCQIGNCHGLRWYGEWKGQPEQK